MDLMQTNASKSADSERRSRGFTLVEMLIVITIIAILMALLFPAFKGVQNQAKRTAAKNDVTQIVSAINNFYTEYGQYPCNASGSTDDGQDYFNTGGNGGGTPNIWDELRAEYPTSSWTYKYNTKAISFIQPPAAKDATNPRSGIGPNDGIFYDPWGNWYRLKIDNNYNNSLQNPYTGNTGAGFATINLGAIAWSLGPDGLGATTGVQGNGGAKNSTNSDDDVISWE